MGKKTQNSKLATVQKGSSFNFLTTIGVMLERREASQGWVVLDKFTFLHLSQNCKS